MSSARTYPARSFMRVSGGPDGGREGSFLFTRHQAKQPNIVVSRAERFSEPSYSNTAVQSRSDVRGEFIARASQHFATEDSPSGVDSDEP